MTGPREQERRGSGLREIGPRPDGGPLEFAIECRLSKTGSRGKKHPVTIASDWSVDTPHDLDAERIGVAFGGYTSCLPLVEKTIPAFRAMLGMLSRQERIPLVRGTQGSWQLAAAMQVSYCCLRREFTSIATAARHVRSANHISRAYDAPAWQVSALMTAAQRVWGSWEGDPPPDVLRDRLIREPEGANELWCAGIRPDELVKFASYASAVGEPLPVSYFLGVTYGNTDPEWISEVLSHRPDADTAAWLTWLNAPEVTASASEWGAWLQFGLPKDDVRKAVEAGLHADRVLLISRELGWSNRVAARTLVAWAKVGCFPTIEQFRTIVHNGVEHIQPSGGAIDSLVSDAKRLGILDATAHDRTSLAVMLMIFGTRRAVLTALRASSLSIDDLNNLSSASSEPTCNHDRAGKVA